MAKDQFADQMMAASAQIKDQIMQGIANSNAIQNEILGAANKAMAKGERQRQRDVAAASGQFIPFTEADMQ